MNKINNWKFAMIAAGLLLSGCATFSPSEEVFKEKANINSRTYDTLLTPVLMS